MKRTLRFSTALAAAGLFALDTAGAAGLAGSASDAAAGQQTEAQAPRDPQMNLNGGPQINTYTYRDSHGDDDTWRPGAAHGESWNAAWLGASELIARLERQGYKVLELEREHNRYEVKMTDRNGLRIKAYFDPATGAPLTAMTGDDD